MMNADQRILFICGSLVPGKAGVGDYCRRLAVELMAAGKEVKLISTSDGGVDALTGGTQEDLGVSVPVSRIPASYPMQRVFSALQSEIDSFSPDVISLQYVPYSFNKYGIPLDFIRRLRSLEYPGRWHVMFHELWITKLRPGQALKDGAISWLQQLSAKLLCRILRPEVVHTNLPVHQERLRAQNIEARPLPLFANIHPGEQKAVPDPEREGSFRIGYFSQLIVERTIPFLVPLHQWLQEKGQTLEIVLLGAGENKVAEARDLLSTAFPDCRIIAPGFLPVDELSAYLYTFRLGVTSVDYHLHGKSGTIAAFLVHKVPVGAPFVTEPGEGSFVPGVSNAIIQEFTPDKFAEATRAIRQFDADVISARQIAEQFMSDLKPA